MSVALCKECDIEIDEQDVRNAGMEEICYLCWCKRNKTLEEIEKGE